MRFAIFLIFAISCASAATEDAPFADEKPLESPRGTFTIQQRRDGEWRTTIHFVRNAHGDIQLTDDYPWRGLFYISPDDHWILHIQKSGSGDNISFLWHVDSEGRIWRMEPAIGALAFAFVERQGLGHRKDLYHTGITFDGWDLPHHRVAFTVHGSVAEHSGEGIDIPLTYDMQRHNVQRR